MFDAPLKVAALMRDFEPEWFVAGGWAIDLFLEAETRTHDDIEIAIFRRDQLILQSYLFGWQFKKAERRALRNWRRNEFLELPTHEIHCFRETGEPRFLEVLLNEKRGADWIFRRNETIAKPLSKLYFLSKSGVKFLRPEIVLLYKSKNPRPKDESDFQATVRSLDKESRKWLKTALATCYAHHHWVKNL